MLLISDKIRDLANKLNDESDTLDSNELEKIDLIKNYEEDLKSLEKIDLIENYEEDLKSYDSEIKRSKIKIKSLSSKLQKELGNLKKLI